MKNLKLLKEAVGGLSANKRIFVIALLCLAGAALINYLLGG